MHLVGAHPLDIRDREHLVSLLKQGEDSISQKGVMLRSDIDPGPKVGGTGAAAKGRAWTKLSPGFAAARSGDLQALKGLVKAGWHPLTATDKNGSSVLDWAAGEGKLSVCRQDPGHVMCFILYPIYFVRNFFYILEWYVGTTAIFPDGLRY